MRGIEGLRAKVEAQNEKARGRLRAAATDYGSTWAALRAIDGKIVTTADIDAALITACSGAVESEEAGK